MIDQETLNNAFNSDKFLNLFADAMQGKNLHEHKQTMKTALEAHDYLLSRMIENGDDISDELPFREKLNMISNHIDIAILNPDYRPDYLSHMEL